MTSYLIRRILYFFPTLIALVILSFLLLKAAPGDPVERMLTESATGDAQQVSSVTRAKEYAEWRHRLGLDLPVFYIGLHSMDPQGISVLKKYIPVLQFHPDNQFHRYVFGGGEFSHGIIHGDLGISYSTRQPVSSLLYDRIGWSLFFTLFSVLLAYLFSVPVGLRAAAKPGSLFSRSSEILLSLLFSLPAFWVASLLLMVFCNPDVLAWLPASGVKPITGYPDGAGWLTKIFLSLPYLVIPTICYTYSSLAFISKTLSVTISDILRQDYIRTARAKGLPEKKVLKKHAYRNALLPVITLFSGVFPYALSGSVILESIFSIPGMGFTIYQSIGAQDYPVIIAVFTLTGIITLSGFLISDLLYHWADPRVSLDSKFAT